MIRTTPINRLPRALAAVMASSKLTFIVMWVSLSIASIAWAGSTPLAGSPDESAHIVKAAAVVRGQFIGSPTSVPAATRVEVPIGISEAAQWPCFAFNPTVSASCVPNPDNGFALHSATTSAGLYNPVYYAIVGLPSLVIGDTELSVLAMRAVSGILSSLFLAVTFTLLFRLVRPLLAGIAFFAAMTPMVLFLNGAVNPNSLEITAGSSLAVGLLYLLMGAEGASRTAVLVAVGASGFLMANARGISPLWLGLIGIAALVSVPWSRTRQLLRERAVLITLGAIALGVLFALVWIVRTGTLGAMGTFPGAGHTSVIRGFYEMLVNRSVDTSIVGVFGWLDTPAPGIVYLIWAALFVSLMAITLAVARGRPLLGYLIALATLVLGPPIVQGLSVPKSGFIWQGRYTLVEFVFAILFAAIAIESRIKPSFELPRAPTSLVIVISTAVLVGQVYSMTTTINRYSGHAASSIIGFLHDPLWAPPGGSVLWIVLLALGVSVPLLFWCFSARLPEIRLSAVGHGVR